MRQNEEMEFNNETEDWQEMPMTDCDQYVIGIND